MNAVRQYGLSLALSLLAPAPVCSADTPVWLGALLPHNYSGSGALPLAVEQINRDATLLPGLTLKYQWEEGSCSPFEGFGKLQTAGLRLHDQDMHALIGPMCSKGCIPTGLLTKGKNLYLVTIWYNQGRGVDRVETLGLIRIRVACPIQVTPSYA